MTQKLRGRFLTEPIKKLRKYFGGLKKVRIFANAIRKWKTEGERNKSIFINKI